jgi:hypothetical protein
MVWLVVTLQPQDDLQNPTTKIFFNWSILYVQWNIPKPWEIFYNTKLYIFTKNTVYEKKGKVKFVLDTVRNLTEKMNKSLILTDTEIICFCIDVAYVILAVRDDLFRYAFFLGMRVFWDLGKGIFQRKMFSFLWEYLITLKVCRIFAIRQYMSRFLHSFYWLALFFSFGRKVQGCFPGNILTL